MPSILFWPGVGGGTKQYRCLTPGAALARAGWDVAYVEDDDANFAVDVVVLQRVLHPHIPALIRNAQRHGVKVVYDIDDWYDRVPGYNPFSLEVDEHLATLHESLAAVDLITVTTDELADGYRRFGPTVVLPNYLDPQVWGDAPRSPHTGVRVGWMGAASWRGGDLDLLRPWLPDFLDRHPEVTFTIAGSPPEAMADLGVEGEVIAPRSNGSYLRPYEHLPKILAEFDIGLVPLAFNRFNQAKSWCKGMEYNAAGVPAVASPSREYRKFIRPGVNGYLVRGDWAHTVEKALDHLDNLRDGALKVAQEHFIDDHIHRWIDAYRR